MDKPSPKRLDTLIEDGSVKMGTRFLYTAGGSGVCREGFLNEEWSGYVRLDATGVWHHPATLFVIAVWQEAKPVSLGNSATGATPIPVDSSAVTTTTTPPKSKRRTV